MGTLLSFVALGFFLGMRHTIDPDHVIAGTTIVSRQRSVRHPALIGVLWGRGHTITFFVVGSAIILFGLVIPLRVGFTRELWVSSSGSPPAAPWGTSSNFPLHPRCGIRNPCLMHRIFK